MPLKCKKCGKCHTAKYRCELETVAAPYAPPQSEVSSGDWLDALHRTFERRADRWETELGNEMIDGRMVAQELRTLIAAYRAGTGSATAH